MTTIAIDLGAMSDYTAMLLVQTGRVTDENGIIKRGGKPVLGIQVNFMERYLGWSYPRIVDKAVRFSAHIQRQLHMTHPPTIVVDATGVGRAIVDMFREGGLAPIALTVHGGEKATANQSKTWIDSSDPSSVNMGVGSEWHIPKKDLVGVLAEVLQQGLLNVRDWKPGDGANGAENGVDIKSALMRELATYKQKRTAAGNESFEAWRTKDHDDLVFALMIGIYAEDKIGSNVIPISVAGGVGLAAPNTDRFGRPLPGLDTPGIPLLGSEPWVQSDDSPSVALDHNGDVVYIPGRRRLPGL